MINKIMPWFVTLAVLSLIGSAVYATSLHPVTAYDVFLLLMMSGSGAGVIMGYFKIYALFEKMDRRDAEWKRRHG